MKLPNGYGSVIKLSGKRRKPYAARITTSWTQDGKQEKKYLGYFKTRQEAMKALADYNENPFDLASREITFADLFERWKSRRNMFLPTKNFLRCTILLSPKFASVISKTSLTT